MRTAFFKIFQSSKEDQKRSVSSLISTPFFWQCIGPFLLMIGFIIFLSRSSFSLMFIGLSGAMGFPFSWKYDLKGAFYAGAVLIFSLLFLYVLGLENFDVIRSSIAVLAFLSSFIVIAMSSRASGAYYENLKQEEEKRFFKIEQGYQTSQKYLETQLQQTEQNIKILEKNLRNQEKEMTSFKQLMIACKEEADKYFMQSEHLTNQIQLLQEQLVVFKQKEDEIYLYEQKNKELLNKLNQVRVDEHQQALLAEDYYKQLKQHSQDLTAYQQEEMDKELQELQKERAEMKKHYEHHLRDYQALSQKLETLFTFNDNKEASHYELTQIFEEKGRVLQEARLDILKIEEAILHLKKELKLSHNEGLTPGSYLAVADQECLRLEEENMLLLKLLTQIFPKGDKNFEEVDLLIDTL